MRLFLYLCCQLNNRNNISLFVIVALYLSLVRFSPSIYGQSLDVPSYFGFHIKPIFPGVFIGTTEFENNKDGFNTTFSQSNGYSFGGIVRVGLTSLIAIETGLNFTQRNYTFESSLVDSNIAVSSNLRYLTYELPVSVLMYLRMSEQVYTNASIGMGVSYNPTSVGKSITVRNTFHQISQLGAGKKVIAEVNANLGFEFRTQMQGFFYLGAIAHVPFAPLFYLRSTYRYQGFSIQTDPQKQGKVDGSYIALEFKYFFPLVKSKGSPIKTPIE